MLGVEAALARVEAGDPGLERGELVLGPFGARLDFLARSAQPADLVLGSSGAALQRVDLADEPGQSLAAVGGGTDESGDPALLVDMRGLGLSATDDRLARALPGGRSTSALISASWAVTRSASASSSSGSRPGRSSSGSSATLRTRSAASPAVPRSRSRSRRQREPGLLRLRQPRCVGRGVPPRARTRSCGRRLERVLDAGTPLAQRLLVGQLLLERALASGRRRRRAAGPARRARPSARTTRGGPPRPDDPVA